MKFFLFIVLCLYIIPLYSATFFEQGKVSFLNNDPAESVRYLEKAKIEEPLNENVYMYLGLSYIQKGSTQDAISNFLIGADLKGVQEGRFILNVGNTYFSDNNYDKALEYYDLIISKNFPEKGDALLNRAQIYLNKKEFNTAVDNYKNYLVVVPDSYQKEKITRLISLIQNKLDEEALNAERLAAEAERDRLLAEQNAADEAAERERNRLANERRRAEDAARQQALMDEILNSLSNISDETQNISADSETINQIDETSDIDD